MVIARRTASALRNTVFFAVGIQRPDLCSSGRSTIVLHSDIVP